MTGGGFKYVLSSFLFGEDEPILTNFSDGWFNHQPTLFCSYKTFELSEGLF